MLKAFFFIGFLMVLIYSGPSTAGMMDDLKNSQEISKLLIEGKLEEAAEIFSKIEDQNMREIVAVSLQGQFLMIGEVAKGESFLEYILNENIRQLSYQSIATQSILIKKDCIKANKYIELLINSQIQELTKMSYNMACGQDSEPPKID